MEILVIPICDSKLWIETMCIGNCGGPQFVLRSGFLRHHNLSPTVFSSFSKFFIMFSISGFFGFIGVGLIDPLDRNLRLNAIEGFGFFVKRINPNQSNPKFDVIPI